jgi:hypothetical protein
MVDGWAACRRTVGRLDELFAAPWRDRFAFGGEVRPHVVVSFFGSPGRIWFESMFRVVFC